MDSKQRICPDFIDSAKEFNKHLSHMEKFNKKPEIMMSSQTSAYTDNAPFKNIVKMGNAALPHVVAELKKGNFFLNGAMEEITGLSWSKIVPPGVVCFSEQDIAKEWVKWWVLNKQDYAPQQSTNTQGKKVAKF